MIDPKDSGLTVTFEQLLDKTVEDVKTALRIAPSLSSHEFEIAVCNALSNASNGTEFEDQISQTSAKEFPDIVAAKHYGVEVKQTSKKNLITSGNSIFEQTRDPMLKFIYIVVGNREDVVWRRYEQTLEKIVVTHSPRYHINVNATETVFEKMGTDYETFRKLDERSKMDRVRPLYDEKSLWWLSLAQAVTPQPMRFFATLDAQEQNKLRATAMILCPEIFGNSPTKFHGVAVIGLSQGVVIPNVRDKFTAGGRVSICGRAYPQIYKRAVDIQDNLRRELGSLDIKLIKEFWDCPVEQGIADRWEQWKRLVDAANDEYKITDVID